MQSGQVDLKDRITKAEKALEAKGIKKIRLYDELHRSCSNFFKGQLPDPRIMVSYDPIEYNNTSKVKKLVAEVCAVLPGLIVKSIEGRAGEFDMDEDLEFLRNLGKSTPYMGLGLL
jgi:hypothetical protein